MQDWQREQYLLHSRSLRHRKKVAEAEEVTLGGLTHMKNPYVAFSCGKDSTVLAHLVLQQRDVPLRFLSSGETRILHNVDDVMDWFRARGATIEEINIDRVFSEEWQDASWTEQRKAGNKDMDLLNKGDWDGLFMGLRAEESPPRKLSLYGHKSEDLPQFCYRYQTGRRRNFVRCCPLARWTTEDVAAYIVAHDLPLLRHYHNRGVEARTTARLTGDAVRRYALADIKRDNPDGWRRLVKRFPELRAFS